MFAIVDHYRARRRTNELLRHAFKLAGLALDKTAEPFTTIIRCTCGGAADNRRAQWHLLGKFLDLPIERIEAKNELHLEEAISAPKLSALLEIEAENLSDE